jgi:hypothetical protein
MRDEGGTVDRDIARIAWAQHGDVTRQQLLAAGVSPAGIHRRVQRGLLFVEYRGVYRVGHRAPSLEARYMAAVLACGEGSLLSGRAAAYLLRLIRGRVPEPEVLALTSRRIPGIRTRRARSLGPRDAWRFNGIPVTTVARTLVDLAAVLSRKSMARSFHEAAVLYRTTPDDVEAVLAGRPSSPGAGLLRAVLRGDVHVTLSKVEERFLDLLRREGLPLPQTNRRVAGRWVDCRWPEYTLTVELDSYRYHQSRHAWEHDHRRERLVRARGDEFRRYTHDDVMVAPSLMLRELRDLLPGGIPSRSR